jgi:hypothetical protein
VEAGQRSVHDLLLHSAEGGKAETIVEKLMRTGHTGFY